MSSTVVVRVINIFNCCFRTLNEMIALHWYLNSCLSCRRMLAMSRSMMHCCHRNFPIRNHISTITVMGKNSNSASFNYKTPTFKVPRMLCSYMFVIEYCSCHIMEEKWVAIGDCYTETFKYVRETTIIVTFSCYQGAWLSWRGMLCAW